MCANACPADQTRTESNGSSISSVERVGVIKRRELRGDSASMGVINAWSVVSLLSCSADWPRGTAATKKRVSKRLARRLE